MFVSLGHVNEQKWTRSSFRGRNKELINNTSGEKLKQNSAKLKLGKKRGIGFRNISRKKIGQKDVET